MTRKAALAARSPAGGKAGTVPGAPRPGAGQVLDQTRLRRLLGYRLRRAELRMRGLVAATLATDDIRAVEFSILSLLADNAEVTQKDLAVALAVKPPNLVNLVVRLEARGLIERAPMSRDRRNQILRLALAGSNLLARLDARLDSLEASFFAAWTSVERRRLAELLARIHAD